MARFRVLLIDDEEELVSTLVERLSFRDVEAAYALTGPDALEQLRDGRFDVVILDLKLPGMSGVDVLKSIKRDWPSIPVLMITGHGSPGDDSVEIPEGADDYLAKPLGIDMLVKKMEEAVNRK